MPLLDDNLSIWKISFRWAGLNPDAIKYRFYIPHVVKDNMRFILSEVIGNGLFCRPLQQKTLFARATPKDEENLTKISHIISDWKYDRRLLKNYSIYRSEFSHWCNRSGIPFPEFWFPTGWTIHELNHIDLLIHENPELKDTFQTAKPFTEITKPKQGKRNDASEDIWKPAKIAAQTIWSQNKAISIAGVVQKIKEMPELKASSLSASAIRKQIAHLSPTPGKPGRKPLKKST
jgi:hypothetical protein